MKAPNWAQTREKRSQLYNAQNLFLAIFAWFFKSFSLLKSIIIKNPEVRRLYFRNSNNKYKF